MPNIYTRATPLRDVVGRVDYITSPHRQERLLAAYDGAAEQLDGRFWNYLAAECREGFEQFSCRSRQNKDGIEKPLQCVQGRELMIQLSNALLERMSPDEICKTIADEFREKEGLTVAIGLHLRSKGSEKDNLHAHVVFSERELLKDPEIKIADRALFYDANGKRRYKKSEILDENKQLIPGCRIVKKGEIYEQKYFGPVNTKYSSDEWLANVKTNVVLPLRNGKLKGDVEVSEYSAESGKLPQQHVGNKPQGETRKRIEAYNDSVKKYNAIIDEKNVPREASAHVQSVMKTAKRKNKMLEHMTEKLTKLLGNIEFLEQQHQKWYAVGELAGVDKTQIDTFFKQRDMSPSDKKVAWAAYKALQGQFWDEYKILRGNLRKDLKRAYKTRARVKEAYWATDPRNRQKSLLGVIFAGIVIARNDSPDMLDREIDRLKASLEGLSADIEAFLASREEAKEQLLTSGSHLEEYLGALKSMQEKADGIYARAEGQRKQGPSAIDELAKRAEARKKQHKPERPHIPEKKKTEFDER